MDVRVPHPVLRRVLYLCVSVGVCGVSRVPVLGNGGSKGHRAANAREEGIYTLYREGGGTLGALYTEGWCDMLRNRGNACGPTRLTNPLPFLQNLWDPFSSPSTYIYINVCSLHTNRRTNTLCSPSLPRPISSSTFDFAVSTLSLPAFLRLSARLGIFLNFAYYNRGVPVV